jgi:hypothetical protein
VLEKTTSSRNGAGKTVHLYVKDETRSLSFTCTNINSKQIKDLNIRPETLKLLQERTDRQKLFE